MDTPSLSLSQFVCLDTTLAPWMATPVCFSWHLLQVQLDRESQLFGDGLRQPLARLLEPHDELPAEGLEELVAEEQAAPNT